MRQIVHGACGTALCMHAAEVEEGVVGGIGGMLVAMHMCVEGRQGREGQEEHMHSQAPWPE